MKLSKAQQQGNMPDEGCPVCGSPYIEHVTKWETGEEDEYLEWCFYCEPPKVKRRLIEQYKTQPYNAQEARSHE